MDYAVIPYDALNREAYSVLLGQCPAATPFHSLDWMRIYRLFSTKACQFLVCAQEGETLLATMPATVFEKFGVRAVFSSGFGVHGGPICRSDCDPQVLVGLLKTFASQFHAYRTVLVSVQDFSGLGAALEDWGFKSTLISTHVMSLPDSYEKLDRRAKPSARYRVRRSAKAGIRTFRSKDTADFECWQQLCSANYISHGRRPYPQALYRAAAKLIQETDTLRFYVAKLDGRVVGGSVQVFALRQGYYWMSATDSEFHNFGVNDAIFEASFRDAITEGIVTFDFGPSPAGAEGLTRFKEKWGGLQRNYHQYSYSSALGRFGANLVRYGTIC
jgi:Acetyltransferase (GNAT) domain